MTKTELNMLLDGIKKDFGLSGHMMQTNNPRYCGYGGSGGWFRMPAFSRPIRADGTYTKYFLNLLKIKKTTDCGKSFKTKDSLQKATQWQSLRYSQFLLQTEEGYVLSPSGKRYIERVKAVKELFDREKEYEVEDENA